MADCCPPETTVVSVAYFVDVEFDDSSVVQPFGPVDNRTSANDLLIALAGREDVKKAALRKETV